MSLLTFAETYDRWTLHEKALFEKGVQYLLAEGSLWREEEKEQTLYTFLSTHFDAVSVFLLTVGWELHVHERYKVLFITHRDGQNRYHFTAGQTRVLLLLRLLYARNQEQTLVQRWHLQMPYALTTAHEILQQYFSLYGKHLSRTALKDYLQLFARFKLIRLHWEKQQHALQQVRIELIPLLEILIPSERFSSLFEQWTRALGESEEEEKPVAEEKQYSDDEELIDNSSLYF